MRAIFLLMISLLIISCNAPLAEKVPTLQPIHSEPETIATTYDETARLIAALLSE